MNFETNNTGRRQQDTGREQRDTQRGLEGTGRELGEASRPSAAAAAMEVAVLQALETPPAVVIPPDFAARVAAQALGGRSAPRIPRLGFGYTTAMLCGVLLLVAMFVFAPRSAAGFSDLRFDLELLLLVELGGIGLLLTRTGFDR